MSLYLTAYPNAGLHQASACLKATVPSGPQWIHEIKYDGYRTQLHVDGGKKRVFTRNGLDRTKRFSTIAGAFDVAGRAIVDGEVVVIHDGRSNFSELQAELAAGRQDRLIFYAFDLLRLNGRDLRKRAQIDRKLALEGLGTRLFFLASILLATDRKSSSMQPSLNGKA